MPKIITTPARGNWEPEWLKNSSTNGMGIDRKESPSSGFSAGAGWLSTDKEGKMTSVVRQTLGIIPDDTGQKQVATRAIQRDAEKGRKAAEAFVIRTAKAAAKLATERYAAIGFPGIQVKAEKSGAGVRLAIHGRSDAIKMARIIEAGSNPMMMHDFVEGAKKKRSIQVMRKNGKGEMVPRGAKEDRTPGFYLIIPKTLGTVKRGDNGKLMVIDTTRGAEALETYQKYNTLEAFTSSAAGSETRRTSEDGSQSFMYRDGKRFSRGADGQWVGTSIMQSTAQFRFSTGADGQISRTPIGENAGGEWEVPKYAKGMNSKGEKNVRAPGTVDDEGNHSRYASNDENSRGAPTRASQKGTKMLAALGVSNLTINEPDQNEVNNVSPGVNMQISKNAGKAVSFMTLSTRQPNKQMGAGRKPDKVLDQALDAMRAALTVRERNMRLELQKDYENHAYETAYLEVILAAMRSPR